MRMRLVLMATVAAVAVAGCANSGEGYAKPTGFHQHEAEELERIEGVGHAEAEREAREAEELARRIQRSGIKVGE